MQHLLANHRPCARPRRAFGFIAGHLGDEEFRCTIVKDESAVTAIEYGLIAALVSITCIGGMSTLGASVLATYTLIEAALVGAV